MILALGATVLGRALWPDSALATRPVRVPWLLPVQTGTSAMDDGAFRNTLTVQRAIRDLTQADLAAIAGVTRK
jgi:hypothetical protein